MKPIGAQAFLYNWIAVSVAGAQSYSVTREVEMAKDPVCNMDVDEKKAPATADYKGKTYYFCAPGCKKAFLQSPEKYLRPSK
jgi:YHS domain-containing protein